MSIYQAIQDFVELAVINGAIEAMDKIYLRNHLIHFLGVNDWEQPEVTETTQEAIVLMDKMLAYATDHQQVTQSELAYYEAALMDFITPSPSQINRDFWKQYKEKPELATHYFYALAKEINQVKTREIAKNIAFRHQTTYGELEITINLSKPEKDPKVIASEKTQKQATYPACALCIENEGLYGGGGNPARSNHRVIRLSLDDKRWGFQYSPYAYYNEHAIVFNETHQPMKISQQTFANLLDFLDVFPHYMIGSNADLPIVGGSILSHDHYQAGRHEFPMMKATIRQAVKLDNYPEITAGIVNWPMSVLRLKSQDKAALLSASRQILADWRQYDDKGLQITAVTADGVQHHTITPIATKVDDDYMLDLVFRDNNTSSTFPDGIFHPHKALHHIKKENIGLIEVMGLAILPPRLKNELKEVEKYLLDQPNEIAMRHLDWAKQLQSKVKVTDDDVHLRVQEAVGDVFEEVLQDAGVFKDNEAGLAGFLNFISFINQQNES